MVNALPGGHKIIVDRLIRLAAGVVKHLDQLRIGKDALDLPSSVPDDVTAENANVRSEVCQKLAGEAIEARV